MATVALRVDAGNRALRTFLVGMATDVGVAVATFVASVLVTKNGWGDLQWAVISFSFVKTILMSIASYVLRRFVDSSGFPTPLPPAPAVAPADPVAIPKAEQEHGQ